jgi:hypothetical protein
MTALERARGWFIAPPPPEPPCPAADPPLGPDGVRPRGGVKTAPHSETNRLHPRRVADPAPVTLGGWQPPVPGGWIAAPPVADTATGGWIAAPPVADTATGGRIAASPLADTAAVTSAAVLGRAGEAEPVAAALALALRRETRAKAATVAVVGPLLLEAGEWVGPATRRLGARLEAHGLEPCLRGRLAWVGLEPEDPQLASAVRRVMLAAAPAVLAITAPRNAAIDEALAEQDLLVVVAADPDGPLAQLAAAGLEAVPVVVVRPLGRGPARSLARAGVRPPRSLTVLLATEMGA